jgi:hypothetical protein
MTPVSGGLAVPGMRRLGLVPWNHDGIAAFTVRAGEDVPTYDDWMIRAALVRGAISCKRADLLGRAINRELWMIGYVAKVETDGTARSVLVDIRKSL